jgi:hypothetical protein
MRNIVPENIAPAAKNDMAFSARAMHDTSGISATRH